MSRGNRLVLPQGGSGTAPAKPAAPPCVPPSCATCKYWVESPADAEGATRRGQCRRFPPPHGKLPAPSGRGVLTLPAVVDYDYWCGEFASRTA